MNKSKDMEDRIQMLLDYIRYGKEEIIELNILFNNNGKVKYEITTYLKRGKLHD